MEIWRGTIHDEGYQDKEITYAKIDENTEYYFIEDGELPNGAVISNVVLKEALGHAPATSLGLISKKDGRVLIPFENKNIQKIKDGLLLVERNIAKSQNVIDAVNNKTNQQYVKSLTDQSQAIKQQMTNAMGMSGDFIFDNPYSEAAIYTTDGINVAGGYFSFISEMNSNYYFATNVLNSQIIKFNPEMLTQQPQQQSIAQSESTVESQSSNQQDLKTLEKEDNLPFNIDIPVEQQINDIPPIVAADDSEEVKLSEEETPEETEMTEKETSEDMKMSEKETSEEMKMSEEETSEDMEMSEGETSEDMEMSEEETSEDMKMSEKETSEEMKMSEEETSEDMEMSEGETSEEMEMTEEETSEDMKMSEKETSEEMKMSEEETSEDMEMSEEETSEEMEMTEEESQNAEVKERRTNELTSEEIKVPIIADAATTIDRLVEENRVQRQVIDKQSGEIEIYQSNAIVWNEERQAKDKEIKSLREEMNYYRTQAIGLTREYNKQKGVIARLSDMNNTLVNQNRELKDQLDGMHSLGNAVAKANMLVETAGQSNNTIVDIDSYLNSRYGSLVNSSIDYQEDESKSKAA